MKNILSLIVIAFTAYSCTTPPTKTYNYDLDFIRKNTEVIELSSEDGQSRVMITPHYQGRVISSSNNGLKGTSNGWVNYNAFDNDSLNTGQNIGGEDRLWIGPLGGQYSFYYQQIKPIYEDNWKVPNAFNAEPYEVINQSKSLVLMYKEMQLRNFIGTEFNIRVNKTISLLKKHEIETNLGIKLNSSIKAVAFNSKHSLINKDTIQWTKQSGLPCIWSLAMLPGSDNTNVYIPLKKDVKLNEVGIYLSDINEDRILINNGILKYKADGKYRNKLGFNPDVLMGNTFASLSPENKTLTIVQYQRTDDTLYFNSEVSIQDNPYLGEPIQVYNHGPMDFSEPNENAFYELESTSAMKELMPNDSITHFQRVYHLSGELAQLENILKQIQ